MIHSNQCDMFYVYLFFKNSCVLDVDLSTILWTKGNINSLNLIYELRFKQRDTNMNVFSSIKFKVIIFPNAKS